MLIFDNVTIIKNNETILDSVSFKINKGDRVLFHGKSGSGKSTILKTLVGFNIPNKGEILFNNNPIKHNTIRQLRSAVSFIGQTPVLGEGTVLDAIELPFTFRINKGKMPPLEKIMESISKLHLSSSILKKDISVISGGEKQRIAIARELLQNKHIFILDEITSALDSQSKEAVIELLSQNEYTVISASHDTAWIKSCSRSYLIESGKIIEENNSCSNIDNIES